MENNSKIFLNTESIDKINSFIDERYEKINDILKKISVSLQIIDDNSISSNLLYLKSEFDVYEKNFVTVLNNIEAYKQDLLNLISITEKSQDEYVDIMKYLDPDSDIEYLN